MIIFYYSVAPKIQFDLGFSGAIFDQFFTKINYKITTKESLSNCQPLSRPTKEWNARASLVFTDAEVIEHWS